MGEKGNIVSSLVDFYQLKLLISPLGWRFARPNERIPGDNVTPDPIHDGYTHLREIYFKDNPEYNGRFTVPTLYDVKQGKIVNNEV